LFLDLACPVKCKNNGRFAILIKASTKQVGVNARGFKNNGDIFSSPNLKFSPARNFRVAFIEIVCEGGVCGGWALKFCSDYSKKWLSVYS